MAFFNFQNFSFRSLFGRSAATSATAQPDATLSQKIESSAQQRRLSWKLNRRRQWRAELKMDNLSRAQLAAKDPFRPRREHLLALYEQTRLDDEVQSQMRTALVTVQRAPFQIVAGKRKRTASEELTRLLQATWFFDYLEFCLEAEWYGHSLVEFDPERDTRGFFKKVLLIPREHVRPEAGEVVLNPYDEKGLDFRAAPLNGQLLEAGKPYDLGLFEVATKLVIRKEFALQDWGRRNERFGLPFLVVKTSTAQQSELDKLEDMLSNFGSNAWAILDDQDDFKMETPKDGGNAYQTFQNLAERMDLGLAKLMNGQTGTANEKAHVGAAEVHERVLNDYTFARLTRIQRHLNDDLLPFLAKNGYPLDGAEFQFTELLAKEREEEKKAGTDGGPSSDGNPDGLDQKKSPAASLGWEPTGDLTNAAIESFYRSHPPGCPC